MIIKMQYANVDTDLTFAVDETNPMGLHVKFTVFDNGVCRCERDYDCVIPFSPDAKYNKIISISLMKCIHLVVDERFDDPFYYETPVDDLVDKVCWFTIPAGYSDPAGLNNIEIFIKGGAV